MSVFLEVGESPVRVRPVSEEYQWTTQYGPRYARLVIVRETRKVLIFAYGFPVRKMLPAQPCAQDLMISATGYGKAKDYTVRAIGPDELSPDDRRLVESAGLDLRRYCK